MRIASMIVLAGTVIASSAAGAQTSSPSSIVRAYFDAIAMENWEAAATLLRPSDLEIMRRLSIDNFTPPVRPRPRTAQDVMRADSTMPLVVAQYYADQANKAMRSVPDMSSLEFEFAGIKDTLELKGLSVVEVGARWIEAQDLRHHMRRILTRSDNCPKEAYSAAAASMVPRFDVIGEIVRADTAWVLFRKLEFGEDIPPEFRQPPFIHTLFRGAGGWQIAPREPNGYNMVSYQFTHCEKTPSR